MACTSISALVALKTMTGESVSLCVINRNLLMETHQVYEHFYGQSNTITHGHQAV